MPELVVSDAVPDKFAMVPPVEMIAPASAPFRSVPPARLTLSIAWTKPPRSSVPPVFTVVALAWLKVFAVPACSTPPSITVAPA